MEVLLQISMKCFHCLHECVCVRESVYGSVSLYVCVCCESTAMLHPEVVYLFSCYALLSSLFARCNLRLQPQTALVYLSMYVCVCECACALHLKFHCCIFIRK